MKIDIIGILAFVLIIVFVAMAETGASVETENYCQMRAIWQDSNGEYGWPEGALGGLTDEVCK